MTTLNPSKDHNNSASGSPTIQLQSKCVTNCELDDLNYNNAKYGATSDFFYFSNDRESNPCLKENLSTYDTKAVVDGCSPQLTEFNFHKLANEDKTEKQNHCKAYDCVRNFPKNSSKMSYNTASKKETTCEAYPKIPSNFFVGKLLDKTQSDSVEGNSVDSPKEWPMLHTPRKQLLSSDKSSFFKKTDNIQPNQVKIKLRSMWNNMKYGWRIKRESNLKADSAAWLLGRCYHYALSEGISQDVSKQLKLDLLSKILLTYRTNFPTIPGTEFISDSGWGCMLRCGQMMMAQALVCHFLNRDWRISSYQPEETRHLYKKILRWFGDSLSDTSPFSLHHLVSLGENYGRKPGDWYGPTHAAQVLRDALVLSQKEHPELKDICMYVALDGIVFKQDVMDLCLKSPLNIKHQNVEQIAPSVVSTFPSKDHAVGVSDSITKSQGNTFLQNTNCFHSSVVEESQDNYDEACPSYTGFGPPSFNTIQNEWKSLILFVSVRLGNDKINPFYIPCLKSLLAYENCIGIIGGRPKHALYFIGWQDDKLIHMDPHSCQPAVDVEKEDFNDKSFHSSSIRTISFTEMDPSCAIGFYFRLQEEFQNFVEKFSEIVAPMKKNLDYPVFALAEGRRIDIEEIDSSDTYAHSSFSNNSNASCKEDDDYILL